MHPAPLPAGAPDAFTITEARDYGISPGRLRAKDLIMPFHGTRTRKALEGKPSLRLLLSALPDHAFACGITAGVLWELPLSERDELTAWTHPHIGVPNTSTRIRRPEIGMHRLKVADTDLAEVAGIRTLAMPRTWVDLSRTLPLDRFVAVTDAALDHRHPLVTRDDLLEATIRFRGGRGAELRREALELCDDHSESPRESMVRVLIVLAGLPRPECNVEIYDHGRFVARVDMLYPDAKLIIEYDGDYHRDPDQWSRDQIRRAELESLGYRFMTVTRRDFDDPGALVNRIRRLLHARP